ncbi:MAG: VOC family protein [bacterium]
MPLLRKVDAVVLAVPSLEVGIAFYGDRLGHRLLWRNDAAGQAGLGLPDSDTELVLSTRVPSETDWLVDDVDQAVAGFCAAGGTVVQPPVPIPVGRVAVVQDPFGNDVTLVDLSAGRYRTDATGSVNGHD